MEQKIPLEILRLRQSYSLEDKIALSMERIREWYEHFDGLVYVAYSGGKDSTALLHLVRSMYPEVPAVFCNTGLEFPELVHHVRQTENVTILRPKMRYRQVLEQYGYPVISKRISRFVSDLQNESENNVATCNLRRTGLTRAGTYSPSMRLPDKWKFLVDAPFRVSDRCCIVIKKQPAHDYVKETGRMPMVGVMACESNDRERHYLRLGCNAYDTATPHSYPIAFWTEQDVLAYLVMHKLEIPSVYGEIVPSNGGLALTGEPRTGCVFCAFGAHLESEPNRFQRLQKTHPKLWTHCMDTLGMHEVLEYIGIPYECPNYERARLF